MHEIPPSEPLASLLRTFDRMGGKVDYVQIGLDEQDHSQDLARFHKAAAIFTVQAVIDRAMQCLSQLWPTEKARWQKEYLGLTQSNLYRVQRRRGIQIRPDQAKGQPVPLARFFALPSPYNRMLELPSWLNIGAFLPHRSQDGSLWRESYPRAFLEPPYGLRGESSNIPPKTLFQAINQHLFGEDINRLTVYQWSTDWIDFLNFQPDQYEFWGSYLWTVSRPFPAPMLGIAAAATE